MAKPGSSTAAKAKQAAATSLAPKPLFQTAAATDAQSPFGKAQARREAAIAAKQGIAKQAGTFATDLGAAQQKAMGGMESAYGTFKGGIDQGRGAIRSQAAEGLAAGQALSGGFGTAGGYGAALQAGKQAGTSLAGYESDTAAKSAGYEQQLAALGLANMQSLGQAQQAAGQANFDALEYEESVGTIGVDRQAKQADVEARIRDIAKGATGTIFDDPDKAYNEIVALAQFETDQEIKDYIMNRAAQVRAELAEYL